MVLSAEILAAIKTEAGKSKKDAKEVGQQIQTECPEVTQVIFNAGLKRGEEKKEGEVAVKLTRLTTLEAEHEKLTAQVEELTNKAPDVVKLRAEIEAKSATKIAGLERDVRAKSDKVLQLRLDVARADFRRASAEARGGGLDPDWAEVQFDKLMKAGRIKVTEDGFDVFDEDGKTPLQVGEGLTPWHALGVNLKATAPDKFITVKGDSGSDTGRERGGSGGSGDAETKKFDDIRQEARRSRNAAGGLNLRGEESGKEGERSARVPSAEERLGMVPRR